MPARRDPVLLIHGIWKSGAAFGRMGAHLRARGFPVHTIDLTPNDGRASIATLAGQVAAFAERTFAPGAPFDLVGFSMGGVVSRYYLTRLGGAARVGRFVSISAPQHGTLAAYAQRRTGAVEMRPGSAFLRELEANDHLLAGVDVTTLWTPLDLMILPPESSRLPGAREVLVAAPLHALMLHDPRAIRAVVEALSRPLSMR
jgi:triacylglycerol lipase